jgi:hypothetical protein
MQNEHNNKKYDEGVRVENHKILLMLIDWF